MPPCSCDPATDACIASPVSVSIVGARWALIPIGCSTRSRMAVSKGSPVTRSIISPRMQKLVLLYRNAVPGSDCSVWPSALSAACCQVSTPCPKYRLRETLNPDMCDMQLSNSDGGHSWVGERSTTTELGSERFVELDLALVDELHDATDVSSFETLPSLKRVADGGRLALERVLHAEGRGVQHLAIADHRYPGRNVADVDGRCRDDRVERGSVERARSRQSSSARP